MVSSSAADASACRVVLRVPGDLGYPEDRKGGVGERLGPPAPADPVHDDERRREARLRLRGGRELLGLPGGELGGLGHDDERRGCGGIREEPVEVLGDPAERAGRRRREDRPRDPDEREGVARGRRVEDDEVVLRAPSSSLFVRLRTLADLAEEEEVGKTRRGAREVAEGRGGEDPVGDERRAARPSGRSPTRRRVEVRRQAVERRGELGFDVAPVGLAEERGRVSAAVFETRRTRRPFRAARAARAAATVVLPTPPLPETTRSLRSKSPPGRTPSSLTFRR